MAIIYSYPEQSPIDSSDLFVVSSAADNKTKSFSTGALLTWIDNNLQYDLQQVLNAGSIGQYDVGNWDDFTLLQSKSPLKIMFQVDGDTTTGNPNGKTIINNLLEIGDDYTSTYSQIKSKAGNDLQITAPQSVLALFGPSGTRLEGDGPLDATHGGVNILSSGDISIKTTPGYDIVLDSLGPGNIFKISNNLTTYLASSIQDSTGALGTAGKILKSDASGFVTWVDDEVAVPGGTTNSIQYKNASGDFDGNQFFLYENLTATSSKVVLGSLANHAGDLHLHSDGDNSIQAAINMFDAGGQPLTIKAPLAFSTDYELTLPVDEPTLAASYLVSNTNGEMSWAAGSGASGIDGTVQLSDGNGNLISSTYLNYNDTANTLNVGVGNTGNSPACGLIIGSSTAKSGTLGILGPNGGKVQFQAASSGSASVDLTFPDATPNSNQILQSDATGQLSWINTPSAVAAAAGAGGDVQINNGANQMGVATTGTTFNFDTTRGTLDIAAQQGPNSALTVEASSTSSTQSFADSLGTANFANANPGTGGGVAAFSTVMALESNNTVQSGNNDQEFITFYADGTTAPLGSIIYDGSNMVFANTSDERLKENKADYDKADAKTKIKALNVKKYSFIADADKKEVKGFFAQQVKEIIPEAVIGKEDDKWSDGSDKPLRINHIAFIPYLTAALQDAQDTIEKLEEQLTKLEKAVEESNTIASDAKDEADAAKEVANDAKVKAEAADDQASDAAGKAQSAFDKASDAEKAASEADEKATNADAKAVKAQADATEAKSTADTAKAKADTNETEIAKKADKEEGGEE
jgi:hypothetical protein